MKKKILVLPKTTFDEVLKKNGITDDNVEEKEKLFFISINCPSGTTQKPYFKENHRNVLNLFFYDVEEDIEDKEKGFLKAFAEGQGKEVIEFLKSIKEKEFTLLIHCTAGISRSGAIGSFASDFFKIPYSDFKKQNPQIIPNNRVLRILNRLYREES